MISELSGLALVAVSDIHVRKLVIRRHFQNVVERSVPPVAQIQIVVASVEPNTILRKLKSLDIGVAARVVEDNSHIKQTAFQKANHPRWRQLDDLVIPTQCSFLSNQNLILAHVGFGFRRHEYQLCDLLELFEL